MMLLSALSRYLVRRAMRTPYTHLKGQDGSLYMERYWLVPYVISTSGLHDTKALSWWHPIGRLLQELGIAVRVHHILRPDQSVHLHDHPWWFVSWLMLVDPQCSYDEERPCSHHRLDFSPVAGIEVDTVVARRRAGSVAVRSPYDRHSITAINGDVWTLFITFRKRQIWGFFTPEGKRYWWQYAYVKGNYTKEQVNVQ